MSANPTPQAQPEPAETRAVSPPRPAVGLHEPKLFINRELSWLEFNARVLEEARDERLPLLERLKFLSIFSSNLDEFFMVRVAGLKQQILGGVSEVSADGRTPAETLAAVSARTRELLQVQEQAWRVGVLPALVAAGIRIVHPRDFAPDQKAAARRHFAESVLPVLTPLAVDPAHPFPHLRHKSLNLAVLLRRGKRRRKKEPPELLAVVQVPSVLARLVRLPSESGECYALLEEVIAAHAGDLFPGHAVAEVATFRVTRNWDLNVDEEESEDLISSIQEELRRRERGAAVRLEIAGEASPELEAALGRALNLEGPDVYRLRRPMQFADFLGLVADARPELRFEPLQPAIPARFQEPEPVMAVIARGDALLHHPYESFEPVVRFVEETADDPDVLAIKQTFYRAGGDSPFIRALCRAAESGKQVTVLVEIKARFDEANNIAWGRRLADSGVQVVYGFVGLKTHCKVTLVVRREAGGIRRYVHLGTGNYNTQTARQYTDLSFFTCRDEFAEDASALFNLLTGYAEPPHWKRLVIAPYGLQERILALLAREAEQARAGKPARIVAKMNALVDPMVIRALYAASQAGVEIDLLVRGICCLRPGVPGVSDRIRVTSVLGRFLEHSRIFAFGEGERAECWLSSADWMPRNFQRRVEAMFPVEEPALRTRIVEEILGGPLRPDAKAWRLTATGAYERLVPAGEAVDSQAQLLEAARRAAHLPGRPPVLRAAPPA
jgi:polyphosphate kinase